METERRREELKHLEFLRTAAIQTLFLGWNLYEWAKYNSGPLKSAIVRVEGAVTAVVGPVCEKFEYVPDALLGCLDKKVDVAAQKFDERAPPLAKKAVNSANGLITKVSEKVKNFVDEARTKGPRGALEYAATEYKQFLLTQTVKVWVLLDHIPTFHKVAGIAIPTVHRWSVKYNYVIKELSQKGCFIFNYFPSVPVDEIATTYKQETEEKEETPPSAQEGSSSDSD